MMIAGYPVFVRPHRSTTLLLYRTYIDAPTRPIVSYKPSSVICRCRSVTVVSSANTAKPIEMPFRLRT